MKFLFRSGWGESLPLARQVEKEGNLVRFSIVESDAQKVGIGLIEKTKDYLGSVGWADVIVFDSNAFDMPKEAQRAIDAGKNVVGSCELAGKLEKDRLFAAEVARKAGIEVNNFEHFEGPRAWVKARKFLSDQEGGWVWKPNGDGDVCSTYVAEDIEEMFRMLEYFEHRYREEKTPANFILTPTIEGIEVSTEVWFTGTDFILANNTVEKNRVFPGDLGEKVGCMGNVVWVAPDLQSCPLFSVLLKPLRDTLADAHYRGAIDVNSIIEKESGEPVFLEFTPRFGYDAVYALALLVGSDFGGLLADCAMGRRWAGRAITDRFAGAMSVSVPPYPSDPDVSQYGAPIFGFDPEKVDPHVMPCEVMLLNGQAVTSGPMGVPFVFTALGNTPEEAMEGCVPEKVKIPLMRYRNDLPSAIQTTYDDLESTEWVRGPLKRSVFSRAKRA